MQGVQATGVLIAQFLTIAFGNAYKSTKSNCKKLCNKSSCLLDPCFKKGYQSNFLSPPSTKISSVVTVVHKKIALKGGASRYPWKAFRNLPRGRGVHNQLVYTFLCIGGTGLLVAEGA